jgi:hypothetical protein
MGRFSILPSDGEPVRTEKLQGMAQRLDELSPVPDVLAQSAGDSSAKLDSVSVVDGTRGVTVRLPKPGSGDVGRSVFVARIDTSRRALFVVPHAGYTVDGVSKVLLPYGPLGAHLVFIGGTRWVSVGGCVPEGGAFENKDGGRCTRLINDTGSASVYGEVAIAGAAENSYDQSAIGDNTPIGAVYEAGVDDGEYVSVATHGRMQVLLEDATGSAPQNWVETSNAAAGRADASGAAPPGSAAPHFEEIGHSLETVVGGTDKLCWIMGHQL